HSRYLKISYLELIVILNNSLKRSLNVNSAKEFMDIQYSTLLAGNNLTDPSYNHSMLSNSIKDFNLWSNPKECSGEDVFSAIEQDKVWAEYKKNYNPYIPFRINITRFEESYKLLHIEK
ncbi:MAG: hypothetical protein KDK36_04960, partial [Leptospiraceae bacterium]|nr:hypothetical protein [Leptospiraceae bacterium]